MRLHEIESWALRVIDQVKRGQPSEDDRVELKAEWPGDAVRAARRIAGHANAAFGEPILWLIGLDEERGVIGASQQELGSWCPRVKSCFDGPVPDFHVVNVFVDDKTVVALLFETERVPFLVKNPAYGSGPGPVELEVPWREGTSTRSARHSDLIRVLSPLQRLPTVDVISGRVRCCPNEQTTNGRTTYVLRWEVDLSLYLVPPHDCPRLVIPGYRGEGYLEIEAVVARMPLTSVGLRAEYTYVMPAQALIKSTDWETIVRGPGRVRLSGHCVTESSMLPNIPTDGVASVVAKLWVAEAHRAIVVATSVPVEVRPPVRGDPKL